MNIYNLYGFRISRDDVEFINLTFPKMQENIFALRFVQTDFGLDVKVAFGFLSTPPTKFVKNSSKRGERRFRICMRA